MSALKLFISHSSRLDDIEHNFNCDDHNWDLLKKTCRAIGDYYEDRVEILVDKDGLIPGEDWNHQLNLWLAECHVAIILFSERAIKKSNWVAKEAAILSWRAEIDPNFTLIPVLLDGQATPEDLQHDFAGILQIGTNQCIRNAANAADVLAGVRAQLGNKDALATSHPQTPLEQLQGGIAKLLADNTTSASMEVALAAVGCETTPATGPTHHHHYANQLARRFFSAPKDPQDQPQACSNTFQQGIDALQPRPNAEHTETLFEAVRPLWVDPCAVAQLPHARRDHFPIALAGQFVTLADPQLNTLGYTLERYLERAWPGSRLWLRVGADSANDIETIKAEIRRVALGAGLPPNLDARIQDQVINQDAKTLVLVITVLSDRGALPDPARLTKFEALQQHYKKLLLVFALDLNLNHEPLPESIHALKPALDPEYEQQAYLHERAARTFLNELHGSVQ